MIPIAARFRDKRSGRVLVVERQVGTYAYVCRDATDKRLITCSGARLNDPTQFERLSGRRS